MLEMGIGIHLGPVVEGNIGSQARAKYGIVGAAVNVTQRIQDTAGSDEIIISKSFFQAIPAELEVSQPFTRQLKGVKKPMQLYIFRGLRPQLSNETS